MKPRELTSAEVTFRVEMEPECVPIDDNAFAIDPEMDKEINDWIRSEIEAGNDWAWCSVVVRATWGQFSGFDSLGCVSCASEEDFNSLFLGEMEGLALGELNANILEAWEAVKGLAVMA